MGQAITGVFTMIDQILSNTLAKKIVETVQRQCSIFKKDEQMMRRNLYGPYTQRRQKYNLTAYVLSGFAPGRFIMNGVTVQDIQYSLPTAPLFQPELHTDTAIIQIYSNGAKLQDNKVVQERCKEHNGTQQNGPHFLLIPGEHIIHLTTKGIGEPDQLPADQGHKEDNAEQYKETEQEHTPDSGYILSQQINSGADCTNCQQQKRSQKDAGFVDGEFSHIHFGAPPIHI